MQNIHLCTYPSLCVCVRPRAQEEAERRRGKEAMEAEERISQLQSERNELAEKLRETKKSLQEQQEGWQREKSKTLALTFSTSDVLGTRSE